MHPYTSWSVVRHIEPCLLCAVLTLGIIIGAFIFASACAYHWSILLESPLALQGASPVGLSKSSKVSQIQARVVRVWTL